jgi:hypothetical protein
VPYKSSEWLRSADKRNEPGIECVRCSFRLTESPIFYQKQGFMGLVVEQVCEVKQR